MAVYGTENHFFRTGARHVPETPPPAIPTSAEVAPRLPASCFEVVLGTEDAAQIRQVRPILTRRWCTSIGAAGAPDIVLRLGRMKWRRWHRCSPDAEPCEAGSGQVLGGLTPSSDLGPILPPPPGRAPPNSERRVCPNAERIRPTAGRSRPKLGTPLPFWDLARPKSAWARSLLMRGSTEASDCPAASTAHSTKVRSKLGRVRESDRLGSTKVRARVRPKCIDHTWGVLH